MAFTNESISLTRNLSRKEKQTHGIFFTPQSIVNIFVHRVVQYFGTHHQSLYHILEPSAGSGEFVRFMDTFFLDVDIEAVEFHPEVYSVLSTLPWTHHNHVQCFQHDFLTFQPSHLYDLIIGNPPYVVIPSANISHDYQTYMLGRPNLFCLFILHSLSMLRTNGILAFILPKSFLNSMYYSKVRAYLKSVSVMIDIMDFTSQDEFLDTQQATCGFIIQKTTPSSISNCPYSIYINQTWMFSSQASCLSELLSSSTTLSRLRIKVHTGTVAWNQQKSSLTSDSTFPILIYNSNLTSTHTIQTRIFSNEEKKQYINKEGDRRKAIVVNRGNGNAPYKLLYSYLDGTFPYLVENHLNVIDVHDVPQNLVDKIVRSFQSPKTNLFISLYLGNNGLSKTELETIFPIFL